MGGGRSRRALCSTARPAGDDLGDYEDGDDDDDDDDGDDDDNRAPLPGLLGDTHREGALGDYDADDCNDCDDDNTLASLLPIPPGAVSTACGAPVVAPLPPVSQLWGLGADVGLRSPSRVWRSPISPVRSPPMAVGLLDWSKGVWRGARHTCVLHLLDLSMSGVPLLLGLILFSNKLRYHCHCCRCTHLKTLNICKLKLVLLFLPSLTSSSNEDMPFVETELSRMDNLLKFTRSVSQVRPSPHSQLCHPCRPPPPPPPSYLPSRPHRHP